MSGKTGEGVTELLETHRRAGPAAGGRARTRCALIFDSSFDPYRGVIAYVRVIDGALRTRARLHLMATRHGLGGRGGRRLRPEPTPVTALGPGEVGYLVTGLKDVHQVKVGDTITSAGKGGTARAAARLPRAEADGVERPVPRRGRRLRGLREALDKLKLNDAALVYEPETSQALGVRLPVRVPRPAPHGHREGAARARVRPRADRHRAERRVPRRPRRRDVGRPQPERDAPARTYDHVEEPMVLATIITPSEYLGAISSSARRAAARSST